MPKAWIVYELGTPEQLRFEDVEPTQSTEGLVRIRVRAAGVNFFDLLQIGGTYQVKPDLPFVPGAEVGGEVEVAPPESGFEAGDRVLAVVSQEGLHRGGYTEVTHADPDAVVKIPDAMSYEEGAAFFINYQTGWFGLHRRACLQADDVVLVHAGAGGVGSAAIQLAKAAGARVIATAGSEAKLKVCRAMGADLALNYNEDDFVAVVKEATGGKGADVIYDPVGGDVFDRSTKCVAFEGRIVVVGFTSGRIPTLGANHVLIKNYSVVGLHWGLYRQRAPEQINECTDKLFQLYAEGKIRPYVGRQAPLADAVRLLQEFASRQTTGKAILTV
ncbi:MAG: NADPH:quinone oxidoreductase family protein [Chloroflexi bacterium]|nr:MAG: NADPH:quinone oxidoreductase family protein [Chloroflexota bacterium]TMF39882.1 MAG: NADPH:quinone oxidoreductase family protein [Chloroflexota bacterium]